jgi:DNA-binding transcriptional ArsR family regulator
MYIVSVPRFLKPGTMSPTIDFDLPAMRSAANQACSLMRVMSNPDRLMLLCQLAQGERRVGELEELLDIQQPTLSQQLAVLRDEALVETRREGKQIFYRITSEPVLAVLAVLYQQYCASPQGDSA